MPSSSEDKSRLVSRESIDGDKCNQDFMMCPGGGHSFGDTHSVTKHSVTKLSVLEPLYMMSS